MIDQGDGAGIPEGQFGKVLDRRKIFRGASLVLAGLASTKVAFGQTAAGPLAMGAMTVQDCIDICIKCHVACLDTVGYSTDKGGAYAASAHLALLLDCAAMCQVSADSLLRRSAGHGDICAACAKLCDACAKSCDMVGRDERLQHCSKTCRDCAESCRGMSTRPI